MAQSWDFGPAVAEIYQVADHQRVAPPTILQMENHTEAAETVLWLSLPAQIQTGTVRWLLQTSLGERKVAL